MIRAAEQNKDPKFFKKITKEVWEFRVRYSDRQIRLLAFWDKFDKSQTLVIASNAFFKKTQKTPKSEIDKAERIRNKYFENI